ncbi:hypothetical protein KSX_43760 [Ktedonospora formicarum]|uniref:Uncharacterized protein n=1 Tax=Ktedonospora formicarum TaxID=2778364 RepID=A0A8J3MU31_9CHLR|nr:hypothetical protein KSX_43760 [Ktedonospora formicarum]
MCLGFVFIVDYLLLYLFKNGTKQTSALGFQQVDTEQDEEEMFALAYLELR